MTSIFDGVSAPSKLPKNRDELVVRGDLAQEVRDQLAPEIRRLETLLRSLIPAEPKTPQVTVQPPQVSVAAPNVTVQAEPGEMEVTMMGMDGLQSEIAALRNDVKALAALLARPVTRTVARDSDGLIERVVESR